jgi:hypothetical protein
VNPPLQPLLGIAVILALAWALSEDRRAVRPTPGRGVEVDPDRWTGIRSGYVKG